MIKWILTPEDYKTYKEKHPEELVPEGEGELYGVKFVQARPSTEPNRATRRAKKRKKV